MVDDNIHRLPRIGLGDATRLFGLTARAIRFYEERGLVEARRDPLNRRYYDAAGRERLGWISQLRHAGVSIPDVEHVLLAEDKAAGGRECAIAKLQARRRTLEAELERVDEVRRVLDGPMAPQRLTGSPRS